MPRAILEIDANTAGIVAAFGQIRTQAQETERVVRASMGNLFSGIPRGSRQAQQSVARDSAQMGRDAERAAQASVRAFIRGEEQKRRAAQLTAEGRARAERQASEHAAAEARKRNLTAEQEARVRQSVLERTTRAVEREERQQTATAEREARRRERAGRDIAFGLRRGLNVGRDAAMPVAREAHSQIQDARRQRADSEHTLNAAFFQAGVGGTEAAAMRRQIEAAVSTGNLRGLSMGDVASGLMAAQTQFSVLSGGTAQERQANFNRQLELASFARSTFQDPAEVMRVAGMLSQQGVRGGDQMSVIRSLTGMAQAGSIELSTLTSTALGPLMANIARSTSSNQTPEARAASVRSAMLETMAVGELTSAGGLTPRNALNALAALRSEVTSPVMAGRVRQRLVNEGRTELADRLTTQDAQGRVTLRNQSAVGFMSDLMQGMGGDTNAVINLLRSGGSRNAMVVGSPIRTLITALASQGTGGRTIGENVARMQAEGARFGEADVERGRALVESEQRTALQSAEEQRVAALTDGTNAVVRFSNALDNFAKANPITSTALQTGGGLLSGVLGGAMINRLGNYAATGSGPVASVVRFLTGAGEAGATVAGAGEAGAAGAGSATLAAPVMLATATVGAIVNSARTAVSGTDISGREVGTGRRLMAGAGTVLTPLAMSEGGRQIGEAIGQYIVAAMRETPVTATVSPVDAAHAATTAAPRR